MFPSINIACAQTLMGLMDHRTMVEESISNVQYFMPLVESLSKKCADGYFSTIEAVMHARLPYVRSPSPEEICTRVDEHQAVQHNHYDFIESEIPEQFSPATESISLSKRGRKNRGQNTRKGKESKSKCISVVGSHRKESYASLPRSIGSSARSRAAPSAHNSNDHILNTSKREIKGTADHHSSRGFQTRSWSFDLQARSEQFQFDDLEFEEPQPGLCPNDFEVDEDYAQSESFGHVSFAPEPAGAYCHEANHLNLPYHDDACEQHSEPTCSTYQQPDIYGYSGYYEEAGNSAQNSGLDGFQVKTQVTIFLTSNQYRIGRYFF
jgi:hypothetical protein